MSTTWPPAVICELEVPGLGHDLQEGGEIP
jgi:hypothetical protein